MRRQALARARPHVVGETRHRRRTSRSGPRRSASAADSLSPSNVRPSAVARPTSRGSSQRAAAVGDQADLGEGLDEARRARRDHDVAAERHVRAGTGGHAVDRSDHRHRHAAQAQRQRPVDSARSARRYRSAGRLASRVGCDAWIGEILAGAEPRPAPVSTTQRTSGAAAAASSASHSSLVHGGREAVERLRPVQGQRADGAVRLGDDK